MARTSSAALAEGGVRAFELTLNEPEAEALRSIEAVADGAADAGMELGAGTVLSIEAAQRAIDAGATFLVMPHLDAELVGVGGGPWHPGLSRGGDPDRESSRRGEPGAAAVKLFPASSAGPSFVRELRGPFPDIPLLPTGGVTLETAPAFISAGAVAVGMGGWLLGDGDPDGIRTRAAQVTAAVADARASLAPARTGRP